MSNMPFDFVATLRQKYRTVDEMDMHGATPPRPPKLVSGDLAKVRRTRRRDEVPLLVAQTAAAIYEDFVGGPPERSCKMRKRPDGPKYVDERFWRGWNPNASREDRIEFRNRQVKRTSDRIIKGLLGRETYAMTIQQHGTACAGIIDYDEGTIDDARLLLRLAEEQGVTSVFIIFLDNRWHAIFIFDDRYAVADVREFLEDYRFTHLKHDVFPSGNAIRLPFQKHQIKGKRGILMLPGGREIDLDTDAGLSMGMREYLLLRSHPIHIDNAAPCHVSLNRENRPVETTPPPVSTPRRPGNRETPRRPAPEPESLPADAAFGKRIWNSPRMKALADASPIFGAVYRGETVTIEGDNSRSLQVSAIVRAMVLANFPENEIRSVMLYRYPIMRPGYARWRDDIERMIAKYIARFADRYDPSPTQFPKTERAPTEKRPTSYERYVEAFLNDPGLSDDEMAQRLNISRSMAGANRRRLLQERPDLVDARKAALKQKTGLAALERALKETPDADIDALAATTGLAESTIRVYRRALRRKARLARRMPAMGRIKKSSLCSINTGARGGANETPGDVSLVHRAPLRPNRSPKPAARAPAAVAAEHPPKPVPRAPVAEQPPDDETTQVGEGPAP